MSESSLHETIEAGAATLLETFEAERFRPFLVLLMEDGSHSQITFNPRDEASEEEVEEEVLTEAASTISVSGAKAAVLICPTTVGGSDGNRYEGFELIAADRDNNYWAGFSRRVDDGLEFPADMMTDRVTIDALRFGFQMQLFK